MYASSVQGVRTCVQQSIKGFTGKVYAKRVCAGVYATFKHGLTPPKVALSHQDLRL